MTTLNYAGIGARATPTAVLASVTIVAGWLWRTGEHLTTGDVQAPVAPLRTVHRNRAPSHGGGRGAQGVRNALRDPDILELTRRVVLIVNGNPKPRR